MSNETSRINRIDIELGDLQIQVDALNAKIGELTQEKTQLTAKIAEEATEKEQKRLAKEKQIKEWIDKVTDDNTKVSLSHNSLFNGYHRINIELYGQDLNRFSILDERTKDETTARLDEIEKTLNFVKELVAQNLFEAFPDMSFDVDWDYNKPEKELFVTLNLEGSNKKIDLYCMNNDFVKIIINERISNSPKYNVELSNDVILTDDSTNNKGNTYTYNLTYEQIVKVTTIASSLRSAINKIDEANNDFINYVN